MRQRLHVVIGPAEVPRQRLAVHPGWWIVRIPRDYLVAQFPQQRPRLFDRGPLRLADTRRQRRRHLGAQRNPQPTRRPIGRGHEIVAGRRHVQKQRGIFHRPGHRAVHTQPIPRVVVRCERHPIPLRLDSEQPAPRRRDPDRTHAIGTQCHRGQACGHRCAAATAAAARRVIGVPRIARRAERDGLGERPDHHLGHRGLTDDDCARLAQPSHHLGVFRSCRAMRGCPVCRHLARDIDIVLDSDGHAEQRQPLPRVQPVLRHTRLLSGGVGENNAE